MVPVMPDFKLLITSQRYSQQIKSKYWILFISYISRLSVEFDIHKSSPRGELFDDHKMTAHLDYNPDY